MAEFKLPETFPEDLFNILKGLHVATDKVLIEIYENSPGESEAIKVISRYDKDACTFPDEFPQKLHESLCELKIKPGNVTLEIFEGHPPDKTISRSTINRSNAKKCGCWGNCPRQKLPRCGKNDNGCFECR